MNREQNGALTLIKEGMEVFDANNKNVGSVAYVRFGDDNPREDFHTETASVQDKNASDEIVETVAEVLVGNDEIPEELGARLLRYGYIRIDGGLLHSDRFATPDQIARVTDHHVELNVPADELITL